MTTPLPLVVHLVYRLDIGGLETLLVDCINRMPATKYRHAVVCLTHFTQFAARIRQPGVELFSLNKPPGLGLATHLKLWRLLRRLSPAILHTYNLAAVEYAFTATLAGVPIRIHAEHGRDAADPEGKNSRHRLLRKMLTPFIDCFVPVSADLRNWLQTTIGIPDTKNRLIHNGVDTERFQISAERSHLAQQAGFPADAFVVGCVGRIQDVKYHQGLVDAFVRLLAMLPHDAGLRLAIIGDGPLLPALKEKIAGAGIGHLAWLPGARSDIAELMRGFSVFALPSLAEGTPVTVLEAMATGLPVVATRVGGVPEAVDDNVTGRLVPPADAQAMATALLHYRSNNEQALQHGAAGRARVEHRYSMDAMLAQYMALYDALLASKTAFTKAIKPCAE